MSDVVRFRRWLTFHEENSEYTRILSPSIFPPSPSFSLLSLSFSLSDNRGTSDRISSLLLLVRSISGHLHFLLHRNSNESLHLNLNDPPLEPGSCHIRELRREETIESSGQIDGERNFCGWS